ncbi:hypothetical protein WN944_029555 [Citrus x changshan-huyou]|uniref:Uncharacterized protein n=1 Tax=Citrus x changshan-huyou TaxID=2935761 RepID=A0AAP0LLH2_9ROSI
MKSPDEVEDCNFISVVDFTIVERLHNCCNKEEISAVTFEELEDEDPEAADIVWLGEKQPIRADRHFESLDLSNKERCMMSIFSDMIEQTLEAFMNDFSVFKEFLRPRKKEATIGSKANGPRATRSEIGSETKKKAISRCKTVTPMHLNGVELTPAACRFV